MAIPACTFTAVRQDSDPKLLIQQPRLQLLLLADLRTRCNLLASSDLLRYQPNITSLVADVWPASRAAAGVEHTRAARARTAAAFLAPRESRILEASFVEVDVVNSPQPDSRARSNVTPGEVKKFMVCCLSLKGAEQGPGAAVVVR